uniref:Uncharacterized protein n=1 Tax=uncultured bacterium Contig1491 TaxID=1393439 RepID=W0FN27_9BACT|nr:hypothetical protein [uncultured bacterium Contig1491]
MAPNKCKCHKQRYTSDEAHAKALDKVIASTRTAPIVDCECRKRNRDHNQAPYQSIFMSSARLDVTIGHDTAQASADDCERTRLD